MDHKCVDHMSASTDTALFADFVHMIAAHVRTCAGKVPVLGHNRGGGASAWSKLIETHYTRP